MSTDIPIVSWVLRGQGRSLVLWAVALSAVAGLYVGLYPTMGGDELTAMADDLPEAMVEAFGYAEIGTAAGYVSSTVYGLLGPVLLMVCGIGLGARSIAGNEESGELELELTGPTSLRSVYGQRLAALAIGLVALVLVVGAVTAALVAGLDLDVSFANLAWATLGLGLYVLAISVIAFAVGAATGRRAIAIAAAAAVGVVAFMFDAIGPTVDATWMTTISPYSWYLEPSPLVNGVDASGLVLLAALGVLVAIAGYLGFRNRDLMV